MKYLLFLLTCLTLTAANTLSIDIQKETNGSYFYSVPSLKIEMQKEDFINELNFKLKFTAPRTNRESLNHCSFYFSNSSGVEHEGYFIKFSLDLEYFFKENDLQKNEGFVFWNTFSVGYEF